jgi:hypothetical protein
MTYVSATAIMAAEKVLTEDNVKPGIIGGIVFLALFVVTYFLWRSMNRHLKTVDANFEEAAPKHVIPQRGDDEDAGNANP